MSKNPHYSVLSSSNHIQKFLTGSIIRNAKLNRYICQEKSTNKATPDVLFSKCGVGFLAQEAVRVVTFPSLRCYSCLFVFYLCCADIQTAVLLWCFFFYSCLREWPKRTAGNTGHFAEGSGVILVSAKGQGTMKPSANSSSWRDKGNGSIAFFLEAWGNLVLNKQWLPLGFYSRNGLECKECWGLLGHETPLGNSQFCALSFSGPWAKWEMVQWNPNILSIQMATLGTSPPMPWGARWQSWRENWGGRMLRFRSGSTFWRSCGSSCRSRLWPSLSSRRSSRTSASSWTSFRMWCTCREEACSRPLQTKCLSRSTGRPQGCSLSIAGGEQRLGCLPSQQPGPMTSTNHLNFPLRKQESGRIPGRKFPHAFDSDGFIIMKQCSDIY